MLTVGSTSLGTKLGEAGIVILIYTLCYNAIKNSKCVLTQVINWYTGFLPP